MKNFRWKTYELTSQKLSEESGRVRLCFLSDRHGSSFGKDNEVLIEEIHAHAPDGILVGGDMIVSSHPDFRGPEALLTKLSGSYPVWYAPGNHEYRLRKYPQSYGGGYSAYETALTKAGVHFLYNDREEIELRGSRFELYGLELEMEFFRKPFAPKLTQAHMLECFRGQKPTKDRYSILLAHNPKFADTYFEWGADLTLSGHYHGGILRFDEHHGLVAPQAPLFPGYCCGDFYQGHKALIVSAGLGEHTLPVRIHNPRELIEIIIRR